MLRKSPLAPTVSPHSGCRRNILPSSLWNLVRHCFASFFADLISSWQILFTCFGFSKSELPQTYSHFVFTTVASASSCCCPCRWIFTALSCYCLSEMHDRKCRGRFITRNTDAPRHMDYKAVEVPALVSFSVIATRPLAGVLAAVMTQLQSK